MVIYDLCCHNNHQFEGWFKSSDDMKEQLDSGLLTCPICSSRDIHKLPTASKLSKSNQTTSNNANQQQVAAKEYQQIQKMLGRVHDYIDKNYIDVGHRFADEAIKMHNGEKEEKNIRGTVSKEGITQLQEAGVSALPVPPKPIDKQNLN